MLVLHSSSGILGYQGSGVFGHHFSARRDKTLAWLLLVSIESIAFTKGATLQKLKLF